MPSRRDQVRKSDSRKSGKSEQDQSDQEEQPQKPQRGSGKQRNQQQREKDRGRADGQEEDPCGRQQQQQQQQRTSQKKSNQQEETINELDNCVKCGEETNAGQVITLSGRKWHPECFTCGGCCVVLAKVSFFMDGERIYCSSCWTKNVKSNCSRCDGEITPEAMVVNFGVRRFHKACFICSRCRCDLAGLQFCIKGNQFTCQQCI
ncbi:LIM domain-binding protein 3 [Taenia crassiceps]|uniref:LIM domain-binding protein 3 n=1 Tax=Taenia crassiceps TaxID=6207 RepID=A0ABR4QF91_9CEST